MAKKGWKLGIRLGIIFGFASLILSTIAFTTARGGVVDFDSLVFPNILLGLPLFWVLGFLSIEFGNPYASTIASLFILLTAYWFVIGLLIGWLYNKFKH